MEFTLLSLWQMCEFKRYNVNLNESLAELKSVDYRRSPFALKMQTVTSQKSVLCIPIHRGRWKLTLHVNETNKQGVLNES